MRVGSFSSFVYACCLLLTATRGRLQAQVVSASIIGTARDSSGAVVTGVRVSAVHGETGLRRETHTNESGYFAFSSLSPGRYGLSASHPGFKSANFSDFELLVDQTARVDFTLEVGDLTEQVTVSSAAPILNTENPTLGQVIEEKPIVELPLNGRNFLQLASLSAGVVPATNRTGGAGNIRRGDTVAHVTGGRSSFTSYLLDGLESRGARFGEITMLPSVDAIKEFKIQRNYYSAEYGQNAAVISVVFKSGTNDLHGSVFEFLRNDGLDARQFFDGPEPPAFRQNQFGFSLGGPVARNRSFFFGAYEGRRHRRSTQSFATLPEPEWLGGDFSSRSTAIRDPFNNNQPFPGNRIPSSRISPVAQRYSVFIPAPNTRIPQGNLAGTPPAADDFDQFHVKMDHVLSASDTISGRYSYSDADRSSQSLTPFSGARFPYKGQNVSLQQTHVFSSSMVNAAKLGYSRGVICACLIAAERNLAAEIGLRNLSVLPPDYSLPRVSWSGFSQLGESNNTFRHWTNVYALSDTLGMIRGRHNLSLGGDIRHQRVPQITTNASNSRLTFTDRFTGFSVADFLLGTYTTATAQLFTVPLSYRFNTYALFLQDDFKVSPKLSLNLGLRWEFHQPYDETSGSEGFFDSSISGLRLQKDPSIYGFNITAPWIVVDPSVRDGVIQPSYRDFAPRVGIAYRLGTDTVIRTGYGIFYAMHDGPDQFHISKNPGIGVNTALTNSPGQPPRLLHTLFDSPFGTIQGVSTSLTTVELNRQTSYMQQWNFNIQRRLPGDIAAELGYIGSSGTHLDGRQDINQARLNRPGENLSIQARRPYPQFDSILGFFAQETSNYHALIFRLERRFGAGLGFLTNYTWSKSIDTASAAADDGTSHHVADNRRLDRGLSSFDIRHRFVTSAIWDLPFGQGRRYLAGIRGPSGWLLDGWQFNSILQLQTGYPFSVTVVGDQSNTGVRATQRPHRIGHGILPNSEKTPHRWFDTSAYVLNPRDTFGNAGKTTLLGDGIQALDISIVKNNYFSERRFNVQFRVEFFNALNTVNFDVPLAAVNGQQFGVVTAAGPAREIQFALKLLF